MHDNFFGSEIDPSHKILSYLEMMTDQAEAPRDCLAGFSKYVNEFLIPYVISINYFSSVEQTRLLNATPVENSKSYMDLLDFNMDLFTRHFTSSMRAINDFSNREFKNGLQAWFNTLFHQEGEDIRAFTGRLSTMMKNVAYAYPQAIQDIEPEFGFHFERGIHKKIAETDRFIVYQVAPSNPSVQINDAFKPILVLPPYVLGANILAFLPGENRSYVHCFANQGIPTYIRVLKDIAVAPGLQVMTGDDDAKDTRYFCEIIKKRHGKPVTLNGYCQGGFSAICDILSGELDGLVDALITCVAPMDGTRSKGLSGFLSELPQRFNDLAYGTKTLPNGNQIADGLLMGWVYKIKSIELETPVVAYLRDIMMLSRSGKNGKVKVSKSAAAINYWLTNERTDLPLGITDMSFASFNTPITEDGTLPVKLFNKKLNLKRIKEKGIKWLICYGEHDDLVEKATALAPLDYIDVETTSFPKGHVAIATSWSDPRSACALHTVFGEKKYRGPVRFQLDLDQAMSAPAKKKKSSRPVDIDKSGDNDTKQTSKPE